MMRWLLPACRPESVTGHCPEKFSHLLLDKDRGWEYTKTIK